MEAQEAADRPGPKEDKGDQLGLVWAKITGYPFWPAQRISEAAASSRKDLRDAKPRKNQTVPVMFFGDRTVAWLRKCDVLSWSAGSKRFLDKAAKNKKLAASLQEALAFTEGTTPHGWWSVVEKKRNTFDGAAKALGKKDLSAVPSRKRRQVDGGGGNGDARSLVLSPSKIKQQQRHLSRTAPIFDVIEGQLVAKDGTPIEILRRQRPGPSNNLLLRKDRDALPNYIHVDSNVYWRASLRPKRLALEEIEVCMCVDPDMGNHSSSRTTGCGADCLNRLIFTRCDPLTCPCKSTCSNLPFHFLKSPPLEVYLTDGKGWGVRSTEDLPVGTFVAEYAGEVVDAAEARRREASARAAGAPHFYMMEASHDRVIDAGPKGNVARLLNSSCDPNCVAQKWRDAATGEVRVGLFTAKAVPAGEELVYNYNFQQFRGGEEAYTCRCGAPNCKGSMDVKLAAKNNKDTLLLVSSSSLNDSTASLGGTFEKEGQRTLPRSGGDRDQILGHKRSRHNKPRSSVGNVNHTVRQIVAKVVDIVVAGAYEEQTGQGAAAGHQEDNNTGGSQKEKKNSKENLPPSSSLVIGDTMRSPQSFLDKSNHQNGSSTAQEGSLDLLGDTGTGLQTVQDDDRKMGTTFDAVTPSFGVATKHLPCGLEADVAGAVLASHYVINAAGEGLTAVGDELARDRITVGPFNSWKARRRLRSRAWSLAGRMRVWEDLATRIVMGGSNDTGQRAGNVVLGWDIISKAQSLPSASSQGPSLGNRSILSQIVLSLVKRHRRAGKPKRAINRSPWISVITSPNDGIGSRASSRHNLLVDHGPRSEALPQRSVVAMGIPTINQSGDGNSSASCGIPTTTVGPPESSARPDPVVSNPGAEAVAGRLHGNGGGPDPTSTPQGSTPPRHSHRVRRPKRHFDEEGLADLDTAKNPSSSSLVGPTSNQLVGQSAVPTSLSPEVATSNDGINGHPPRPTPPTRRGVPHTPPSMGLPPRTILVAKRLTNSDVTKGRILLPRAAVEANLSFATHRAWPLSACDAEGRTWRFTLQSWANGMESRRVYVLEHAAQFIHTHDLRIEDVIGLSRPLEERGTKTETEGDLQSKLSVEEEEGGESASLHSKTVRSSIATPQQPELLIEINTPEVLRAAEAQLAARAAAGHGGGSLSPSISGGAGSPILSCPALGPGVRCARSPLCTKPAGHPGFCTRSGQQQATPGQAKLLDHPQQPETGAYSSDAGASMMTGGVPGTNGNPEPPSGSPAVPSPIFVLTDPTSMVPPHLRSPLRPSVVAELSRQGSLSSLPGSSAPSPQPSGLLTNVDVASAAVSAAVSTALAMNQGGEPVITAFPYSFDAAAIGIGSTPSSLAAQLPLVVPPVVPLQPRASQQEQGQLEFDVMAWLEDSTPRAIPRTPTSNKATKP